MRQITKNVYTAAELREHNRRAFGRALEKYRANIDMDGYIREEIFDSLKGLCEAAGVKIKHYNLGAYNRGNDLRVEFNEDGAEELTGARALAWVENNLLAPMRIPWTGPERWKLAKYGEYYRPGLVKPCPFTGVCYDEYFLDALLKDIRTGHVTLREAFNGLSSDYARMLEDEYEYQAKEETFLEDCEANGWEFDEDGRMV
jgi:hypothetical protein